MPTPDGRISLVVCIPHGRDLSSTLHGISVVQATLRLVIDPRTQQQLYVHPQPIRVVGDEYARGRNSLVEMVFQAERELGFLFDYSLWIDDDVVVPTDVIEQLLAHDKALVSGLYFMRKPPFLPVAYTATNDPKYPDRFWNLSSYPDNACISVDAAGMGCVLVRNEVFRHIPSPWFEWTSPYKDRPDQDHRSMGEDMYFFTRAKQYGYQLYLSTKTVCQHIGEQLYDDAFFKQHQVHYFRLAPEGRKAICFLVPPAPKAWDGRTLYDEALGGTEASVAYLARAFARRHHIVFVVCNTRNNDVIDVDGVCYRPYTSTPGVLQHAWDSLVIVRWADAALYPMGEGIKSVIFWAHDYMSWEDRAKAYGLTAPPDEDTTDVVVTLSTPHQSHTKVTEAKIDTIIIPNGIDLSLYKDLHEERVLGRLLWTSNPNRGLMSAVRIFRRLRQKYPFMELHVYGRSSVYGWTEASDPMHEAYYLPPPDEPGVFLHDPLPKAGLAQELARAWALFYPTHWPETFCIAALEAQAVGTPVISVPYGALPFTIAGGLLDWDVERSVEQLMDPASWELISLRGRDFAAKHDWDDKIADTWELLIDGIKAHREEYLKIGR